MKRLGLISAMFAATMMIGMTFSGCKKDKDNEKGHIELAGKNWSLHVATLSTSSATFNWNDLELRSDPGGNNSIKFELSGSMEDGLPAGSYTTEEKNGIKINHASLSVERNIGLGNQLNDLLLVVKKSGNDYEITVTGKTQVKNEDVDFKVVYKGKIEVTKKIG